MMDYVLGVVLVNLLLVLGFIGIAVGTAVVLNKLADIMKPKVWEDTGVHKHMVIEWSWDRERVIVRHAFQQRCFQTGQLRWVRGTRRITWTKAEYEKAVADGNVLGPGEKVH